MPFRTRDSHHLLRDKAVAAQNVYSGSDLFEMSRVDTATILTKVVKYETRSNASNQKYIGESVGVDISLTIPEVSVPVCVTCSSPIPTSIRNLDLSPKSLLDWLPIRMAITTNAFVPRLARSRLHITIISL